MAIIIPTIITPIKTIIIGRKGSGKSAIFSLLNDELDEAGTIVIPITPNQYSWSALKKYKENGILPIQAHTNAWKLTLLASVILKLNETGNVSHNSKLVNYYKYLKDSFSLTPKGYYTTLYGGLGLVFGLLFGVAILSNLERSLGISLGLIGGMVIGSMIGRSKDAQANEFGNMI